MKHSAGIALIYEDKLLLVHPSKARWSKMYGIPKGGIEEGESEFKAAIRETKEEIGFAVDKKKLKKSEQKSFFYLNKKGKKTKKITFFEYIVDENELSDLGMTPEKLVVPKEKLQLSEVDWAGFISKPNLVSKLLPNQFQIVELLSSLKY